MTDLVEVHEPLVFLDEDWQHPVRPDCRRPAQGLSKVAAISCCKCKAKSKRISQIYLNITRPFSQTVSDLVGSLKLGNVWVFVLETSYQLWTVQSLSKDISIGSRNEV